MILVIQYRSDQSGPHEVKCIFSAGSLPYQEYIFVNIRNEDVLPFDVIKYAQKADAVILGGLGEIGFESKDPDDKDKVEHIRRQMRPVLETITDHDIPTLGLCFGHQLLADYLGSSVVKDNSKAETGIADIHLTDDGKKDPVLGVMDPTFPAVVGHKASVIDQPQNTKLLAFSDRCSIQAFRYKENIYGCQFHPELDSEALFERLRLYPEYMENEIEYDEDTPIKAKKITERFLEVFSQSHN